MTLPSSVPLLIPLLAAAGLASSPARACSPSPMEDEGEVPVTWTWLETHDGLDDPIAVAYTPGGEELAILERGACRVRLVPEGRLIGEPGSGEGQLHAPCSVAVSDAREIFVADTGNDRIQVFGWDGSFITSIGTRGAGDGQLLAPRGVAVRGELLAVADTGNDRIQLFSTDGEYKDTIGARGRATGQLASPSSLAFTESGELVVGDLGNYRIQLFGADGTPGLAFGDYGYFPGLFSSISGVATGSGWIHVSDSDNHCVQVFDSEGELLKRWGIHAIIPREGRGKLHYPAALAFDPTLQRVAIVETGDDRVQVFQPSEEEDPQARLRGISQPDPHFGRSVSVSGERMLVLQPEQHQVAVYDFRLLGTGDPAKISRIGGFGRRLGLFERPTGVAYHDDSFHGWICDTGNRALHELVLEINFEKQLHFDPESARFIRKLEFERLGTEFADVPLEWTVEPIDVEASDGAVFVLCARNERVFVFDAQLEFQHSFGGRGEGSGEFLRPVALAWDATSSQLCVVDQGKQRVATFDRSGKFLRSLGDGELSRPMGVTSDDKGQVFVTDAGTDQVLRFKASGELDARWGKAGFGRLEFLDPAGLGMDGSGLLFIMDHGNHRLIWLTTDGEHVGVQGPRLYSRPARFDLGPDGKKKGEVDDE